MHENYLYKRYMWESMGLSDAKGAIKALESNVTSEQAQSPSNHYCDQLKRAVEKLMQYMG